MGQDALEDISNLNVSGGLYDVVMQLVTVAQAFINIIS